MVKAPSKVIAVVMVALGVAVMIMLNLYSQKLSPKSDEQAEQEAQAAAQAAAAKNAPAPLKYPGPMPGSTGAPSSSGAGMPATDLVRLGEDTTVGASSVTAPEVTVNWSWTPEVEKDPSKVSAAISGIQGKMPNVRIHVVNTDELSGVPNGIFVGGHAVTPAGPDGSITLDPAALKSALGKK